MIAFGATDKDRGQLSRPPVTRDLDPAVESEKSRHIRCLATFDLFATDDDDRCKHFVTGDRNAGCRHHDG